MSVRTAEPVKPLPPIASRYGPPVESVVKRAYKLPEIVSVRVRDLFPDIPSPIYPGKEEVKAVREATRSALEKVDMSMIKSGDSVNVLGSHHGFTILGGEPYAEMLRTIRDVIAERTGTDKIRLRVGVGLRHREGDEHIQRHKLDKHYDGKAKGMAPIDAGFPIATEIGTLYGIREAYNAKWIVHAHNSDVREIHFHRHVDRAVKPFGMSYARIETRSTYHHNLGPRAANFVARAVFTSKFVQDKWTFACFLQPSPAGIIGVDADNDLFALDERLAIDNFKYYGKILTLLSDIEDCITVLDFSCPIPYVFVAGMIFANFSAASVDMFDLNQPLPGYTWYTETLYGKEDKPLIPGVPPLNPAIRALVINYAWGGYPSVFWVKHIPTIVVGEDQARVFDRDPQNVELMRHAVKAESLETAVNFAKKMARIDKILIFDGAPEVLNVSESLAEDLIKKAPEVSERTEKELMPNWCKQRGIEYHGK